jgi:hypothetical protein
MPSTRYTVRLPPALDAAVQARVHQGTPFAVLIREALAAYLADTPPTGALTGADTAPTPADTVRELQEQLASLTRRVEALEQAPTPRRQATDSRADRVLTGADRSADTVPTGADTPAPAAPQRRPRRPSGPLRQQILTLLQAHPEGLRAEELRVYLQTRRPIGDTLQGMLKGGVISAQGRGGQRRYVVAE